MGELRLKNLMGDSIHGFVEMILRDSIDNPDRFDWSIQGFGMLRLYMPQDMRLNVWHSKYRVPNVSLIHTHPWNFDSFIERGRLINIRYERTSEGACIYGHALLKPGPRGGLMQNLGGVSLRPFLLEAYTPGDIYHQDAAEIHMSLPADGCVTINMRERVGPDEALVFWPIETEWVSAEPRKATAEEIREFCLAAIENNPLKGDRNHV